MICSHRRNGPRTNTTIRNKEIKETRKKRKEKKANEENRRKEKHELRWELSDIRLRKRRII